MTKERTSTPDHDSTARHLAARAIMGMRAGFPVEAIVLPGEGGGESGIVCDWKLCRGEYSNDVALIRRAFAFVYIGTILDQTNPSSLPEVLMNEIKADQAQSQDIRETAAAWGVASSVMDTNPFAHVGYKLASQVARLDGELITQLAQELVQRSEIEQAWLTEWYTANAQPRALEEIEESGRY